MAEFTASVYQNEFLPDGGTDVNAIVTVTCSGAGTAGQSGAGAAGEIIIVDTSGSMGPAHDGGGQARGAGGDRRDRRRHLVRRDRGLRPRDARLPAGAVRARHGADGATTREDAQHAVSRFVGSGGTAISTWLDLAGQLFASVPELTQRHAILLTDGENRETPDKLDAAIAARHRLLPVRLPRRRHRLAGRGDPPDRHGAARHRRHHPGARRRCSGSSRR